MIWLGLFWARAGMEERRTRMIRMILIFAFMSKNVSKVTQIIEEASVPVKET